VYCYPLESQLLLTFTQPFHVTSRHDRTRQTASDIRTDATLSRASQLNLFSSWSATPTMPKGALRRRTRPASASCANFLQVTCRAVSPVLSFAMTQHVRSADARLQAVTLRPVSEAVSRSTVVGPAATMGTVAKIHHAGVDLV